MNQTYLKPFDSLVVMGKIHKLGADPVELQARVAFAACLMLHAPQNVILATAGGAYLPDTDVPVAQIVKQKAMQWGVPEDRIVTQNESNNTIREVKVIQDLLIKYKKKNPVIISHGYHLRRTQIYFQEIGLNVQILACSTNVLNQILPDCVSEMHDVIARGQISNFNTIKEYFVETVLSAIHLINPSGRLECWLADSLRDGNT